MEKNACCITCCKTPLRHALVVGVIVFVFIFGYRLGKTGEIDGMLPDAVIRWTKDKSTMPSIDSRDTLNQNDRDINFDLFWETWDLLERKFVDRANLKTQNLYYGAIKGMVASAQDPYTFFLTPEENKSSKDSLGGRFEGIGAQLGTKDGRIVVVAPIKDSPAVKAGIRAGDIIVSVDGKKTEGQSLAQVVSRIRGTAGTTVTLLVLRGGQEIEFKIVRAQIQVDSVEFEREGDIAVVRINQFGDQTNAEWQTTASTLAADFRRGTIKGMVLDLRDNPGGYLESAVFVASEFLPRNKLVVKQEGVNNTLEFTVKRDGSLQKIPLVVLVNSGSASAAEILAGSLRDHKRAQLVGEKTFGKGSVQEALDLSGGSGLHVTIAKWILPAGDWINGRGITPETVVENEAVDEKNTTDARAKDKQLDRAIELLKKTN
jgi:carboxyl-terminal processing protease